MRNQRKNNDNFEESLLKLVRPPLCPPTVQNQELVMACQNIRLW